MAKFHIAQFNIATAKDDIDSDTLAPFIAQLDEINALADASPGFVWRLSDDSGNATSITPFEDPRIIVNMSVWEDVAPLEAFVYKSAHSRVMSRRREWFAVMKQAYHVLWWVEAGRVPTLDEARQRLQHLQDHGPSVRAFTFKSRFASPVAA